MTGPVQWTESHSVSNHLTADMVTSLLTGEGEGLLVAPIRFLRDPTQHCASTLGAGLRPLAKRIPQPRQDSLRQMLDGVHQERRKVTPEKIILQADDRLA